MTIDVLIVGAGPAGLTTANLLARYGVSVHVVEASEHLLDYPRGVGIDDESLRTFQTTGLVDEILPHTAPNHIMRFLDRKGRLLAEMSPTTEELGFSRRNAFIQPLIDAILFKGLSRYPNASVQLGARATEWREDDDGVEVTLEGGRTLRARYVVGADGGRSSVRRAMGVSFEGQSSSTRWLVVDLRVDPLGHPNCYIGADPARPWVSISLPHGVRRFEFMLKDDETDEDAQSAAFVSARMKQLVGDAPPVDMIRARVYTHHSRIAGAFRKGRMLLAGDAAHLMPVWQGQGFNSGIRDASNLAWKLAAVVRGLAEPALLDSYDAERRDHALAMIRLSTIVGKVVSPTNPLVARARDALLLAANAVPSVKAYIVGMRFKPMPRYRAGAVVFESDASPVGKLFIQPRVATREAANVRLDDVLGDWFSLVVWNNDPSALLDADARAIAERLGVKLVALRPQTQLHWTPQDRDDVTIVGDSTGALKRFFDTQPDSVLLLRPDRVVLASGRAYQTSAMIRAAARALSLRGPSRVG